jgi:hypothetical protein
MMRILLRTHGAIRADLSITLPTRTRFSMLARFIDQISL